jgi:cytochrome oxidase assembly protein ShyY1
VSWRFARTPKWIVRHVLVLLLVAAMITALFWQLSRLHQKRSYKALVERREQQAPEPVQRLLPAGVHLGDQRVGDVLYRQATATGTYVADRTFTVENRTDVDDTPGAWVLTPLDIGGGRAVLVNRGFQGYDTDGKIIPPPPPAGTVTVTGLLFPTQTRGFFGAKDPKAGVLTVMARVDLARVDEQVDEDLLPAYLQASTSRPPEAPAAKGQAQLEALGPPELSEGPHFSYAVQWGIFSTIAVVGYAILLRKVAIQEAKDQVAAAAGPPAL